MPWKLSFTDSWLKTLSGRGDGSLADGAGIPGLPLSNPCQRGIGGHAPSQAGSFSGGR